MLGMPVTLTMAVPVRTSCRNVPGDVRSWCLFSFRSCSIRYCPLLTKWLLAALQDNCEKPEDCIDTNKWQV